MNKLHLLIVVSAITAVLFSGCATNSGESNNGYNGHNIQNFDVNDGLGHYHGYIDPKEYDDWKNGRSNPNKK